MITKQEIPSESRHQVVNKLKELRGNIILTGSALGIPETYLVEYQRECSDKIVTVTEIQEMKTQMVFALKENYEKIAHIQLDMLDMFFYIEAKLVIDLCDKFINSKIENTGWSQRKQIKSVKKLIQLKDILINKQQNFYLSLDQQYREDYEKYMYLGQLREIMEEHYNWEWGIMNMDKPIEDARILQKCMKEIMTLEGNIKPSRVILTAYDSKLQTKKDWNMFTICKIDNKFEYYELVKISLLMLHNLYPTLQNEILKRNIKLALSSPALHQLYLLNGSPVNSFIQGIREFYEICIRNTGEYKLTELKCFALLYDCILKSINNNSEKQNKKPKLYI